MGLPLRFTAANYDWKSYSPRPQDRSEWNIGSAFVRANPPDTIRWSVFLARCSLIPLIVLGSWFGYKFASELYGRVAGLVFLTLWTFSPLVLGWGATLCPDVVAASLGIVACYAFWHWLKNPTWQNTLLSGFTLGLLPLAKLTWIIAFPIWLVIWCVWGTTEKHFFRTRAKQFATIFLLSLYVINMGYGFDGSFRLLKDYTFISHTLTGTEVSHSTHTPKPGNRFAGTLLGYVPVPFPAEFVQGIDTQKLDFERGIESYFLGEYSKHGWLFYYAYVLLVREPLGTLGLIVLAVFCSVFRSGYNVAWRDEMVILLPGIALLAFVSSQTGFSLHPRYVIPVLPFAYLWTSKVGKSFSERRWFVATSALLFLAWTVASSLCWYPHSISYFNELVCVKHFTAKNPPPLLGSNIDWGQNSYFLKTWYDRHPLSRPMFIAYSSSESLDRLGIESSPPPKELVTGYYAIGINELFDSSNQYAFFRDLTPVDRIGYSIYVYHITPDDSSVKR
ncbi:MAG: ArnT family glycosyltransferase [Thermoguttaceae bacterium]